MFEFKNNKQQKTFNPNPPQPPTQSSSLLLEPKLVEIKGIKFVISKMPCTTAQEVLVKLPQGFLPMLNQFETSQQMAFKMLSYCERVYEDGRSVPLISKEIIDNNVPDFQTLLELESACMQYNFDFFEKERLLTFLSQGLSLVESKASKILTDLLDKLLQVEKLH